MKYSKRLTALALSAVMMFSQAMPVLADNATGATAGDGNILAYTNNEVLAPTAIKVSFNPQGYDVYESADAEEKLSSDQIVSLNYGFASNATNDILAGISFEADFTGAEGITFVDSAEEVENAKKGELKVYLAVATNKNAITAAADDEETAFKIQDDGTSNVTAALLADVAMEKATENNVAFVSSNNAKAEAEIALSMNKAVYTVDEDEKVTFATDQTALKDLMVLHQLGGINGFTFTGAMNADADWTKAKVTAISITPTFDLTKECTGEEEILEGTAAQVGTAANYTISEASNSVTFTGLADGVKVSSVVLNKSDGGTTVLQTSKSQYSYSDGKLTVAKDVLRAHVGETLTVTFSDSTTKTVTIQ